jgi:hypothetical protein
MGEQLKVHVYSRRVKTPLKYKLIAWFNVLTYRTGLCLIKTIEILIDRKNVLTKEAARGIKNHIIKYKR